MKSRMHTEINNNIIGKNHNGSSAEEDLTVFVPQGMTYQGYPHRWVDIANPSIRQFMANTA